VRRHSVDFAVVVAAAALALAAASCGASAAGQGSGATSSSVVGDSVPQIVSTVQDAGEPAVFPMKSLSGMTEVAQNTVPGSGSLPFNAVFPKSAGAPMGVFVSIAADSPPNEVTVDAEYDGSSPYGAFRLTEEKTPPGAVTQSFIQQIPNICGTCSDARLIDLGGGIQGALLAGPDNPTSVTWLQGPFKMIVMGPSGSFSASTAETVAKEVASAFSPTS
jgi:hypothetical protein